MQGCGLYNSIIIDFYIVSWGFLAVCVRSKVAHCIMLADDCHLMYQVTTLGFSCSLCKVKGSTLRYTCL